MVESQGKVSEKSGNFEMDIEWQPCYCLQRVSKVTGCADCVSQVLYK